VLTGLLGYDEETAGGFMTSSIIAFPGDVTVADAQQKLRSLSENADFDGVLVVDADGVLVDDVHMFDLFTAEPDQRLIDLTGTPWPVTVTTDVVLDEVVEAFVENRGSSVVVVDGDGRPLGRILADDVVDALLPDRERGRRPFSGLLS
jgi:Mg/Co/Ni transporter MgtE